MITPIRIGTRESELALWQANTVKDALEQQGFPCVLVPISSQGDKQLQTPLYELGIVGVFTKTLDIALLEGRIDIAVHSMKDVPTALPQGIAQFAVLKRGNAQDILVHKAPITQSDTIATGSLRRKAQWLNKYPNHTVVGLRGNVNTRLKKLEENTWNGAIFAKAGLERIHVLPENHTVLNWMIPAPAQGAIVIAGRQEDTVNASRCQSINHQDSAIATHIEREFLKTLEGGCTAPIGAHAIVDNNTVKFIGCLHSLNGQQEFKISRNFALDQATTMGKRLAQELLDTGARQLMQQIKKEL